MVSENLTEFSKSFPYLMIKNDLFSLNSSLKGDFRKFSEKKWIHFFSLNSFFFSCWIHLLELASLSYEILLNFHLSNLHWLILVFLGRFLNLINSYCNLNFKRNRLIFLQNKTGAIIYLMMNLMVKVMISTITKMMTKRWG